MNITIQKAKNGEDTASVEGHFLHSNYAPKKEAERFAENLNLPYTPSSIIITEPALSYSAEYLKNKFPGIKIGAIRYTDSFNSYNNNFDFVINYYEHTNFENYLEARFTEEELLTCFFTPWQPSAQIFSDTDKIVWNAIKASMIRAKTLLITRQYFEKKWFLNSCNFIKLLNTEASFNTPVNKTTLIISSGPSLKPFINLISKNRNKFFIICLSSAITVCLENNIKPDLCMSTDGGYWAGEHLKALKNTDIPLAMPSEAYCNKKLFSKLNIIALDYGDGISHELLNASKLNTLMAVRNGTVSGTALLFAAAYCTKDIYLCGLDMAGAKGYQHSQPNQLEINSSLGDTRIKTKQFRLTRSELTNGSLDIYRDWFCNNPLQLNGRKVYRLIEKADRKNNLVWIKDIGTNEFEELIKTEPESAPVQFTNKVAHKDLSNLTKLFENTELVEAWKKQLFPLDYVLLSHNPDNTQTLEKIETEWNELKRKAEELLNDNL